MERRAGKVAAGLTKVSPAPLLSLTLLLAAAILAPSSAQSQITPSPAAPVPSGQDAARATPPADSAASPDSSQEPVQYSDDWWTLQLNNLRSEPGVSDTLLTPCDTASNAPQLPINCTGKLANYSSGIVVDGSSGALLMHTKRFSMGEADQLLSARTPQCRLDHPAFAGAPQLKCHLCSIPGQSHRALLPAPGALPAVAGYSQTLSAELLFCLSACSHQHLLFRLPHGGVCQLQWLAGEHHLEPAEIQHLGRVLQSVRASQRPRP